MDHPAGLRGEAGALRLERRDAPENRLLRRLRRGQHFRRQNATACAVHQHEVGEGAADVDAEPVACRHACAVTPGCRGWTPSSSGAGSATEARSPGMADPMSTAR